MLNLFRIFDRMIVGLGLLVTLGLIALIGFDLSTTFEQTIFYYIVVVSFVFAGLELFRFFRYHQKWSYLKDRPLEGMLLSGFFAIGIFLTLELGELPQGTLTGILGGMLLMGFFSAMVDRVSTGVSQSRVSLRPAQVFLLSFLLPVIAGGLMLKLPRASTFDMSWVDAFFMATSAVCVTGLGVFDLQLLTPLGQTILLVLIQIGGLGIMTLSLAFSSLIAGGLGVRDRIMLGEMLSENKLSEVKSLLFKICLFTFVIEFFGAWGLYFSQKGFGAPFDLTLFWHSLFHSISAFCNAGFSLFSANMMHASYAQNWIFLTVLMSLIVLGGLGFPTLSNLQRIVKATVLRQREFKIVTTSTKMILWTSGGLLLLGAALVFVMEGEKQFAALSWGEKILQSAFLSVTSRTAGFNLFPTEELSLVTLFVVMFLMWIGGAPMSTAGGIKVTTFFVSVLNLKAQVLGMDRLESFGREIGTETIRKAYAVVVVSLSFIFLSTLALVYLEPEQNPVDLLFEVISAVSTVGLSRALTPELSDASKVLVSLLMFFGRVGMIAVLAAFIAPLKSARYKLLKDDVMIQ